MAKWTDETLLLCIQTFDGMGWKCAGKIKDNTVMSMSFEVVSQINISLTNISYYSMYVCILLWPRYLRNLFYVFKKGPLLILYSVWQRHRINSLFDSIHLFCFFSSSSFMHFRWNLKLIAYYLKRTFFTKTRTYHSQYLKLWICFFPLTNINE